MADKENKGGILKPSQLEEELKAKGRSQGAYEGAQDTGDKAVRQLGTEVQRQDGRPPDHLQNEE